MAQRTTPRRAPAASDTDLFDMRPDGRCVLTIKGEQWRFRRPRLGEFRTFREQLNDRDDEMLRLMTEASTERQEKAPTSAEAGETERTSADKLATALEAKAIARRLDDAVLDMNLDWLEQSLSVLLEEPQETLPPRDDWPPDMAESAFLKQLIEHWRHRPLAPGAAVTPLAAQ